MVDIDSVTGLEDHPDGVAGYDLMPGLEAEASAAGVTFAPAKVERLESVDGRWKVMTDQGDSWGRAVVVATGSRFAPLGVPGEAELAGRGVGHCASCDGPLLAAKTAVVVGGGDSALQETLSLLEHVAAVILVDRATELSAQPGFVNAVKRDPKVTVRPDSIVDAILGERRVEAVRIRDLRSGMTEDLPTDAVFVYVGQLPNSEPFAGTLAVDEAGRIVTTEGLACSEPGVFAAGTVRRGNPFRAGAARREGIEAARSALAHVREETVVHRASGTRLLVHDPRGFAPEVAGKPLAPRLETLDGKHLYLVDCLFDNSDRFVEQLEDWFAQNHPEVDTEIIRPRESWVDDPDMRAAVEADGDAAIVAVGL